MLNTIIEGNTLDILKTMPDNSVDCVITSPPYWGLRKYGTDPQIFGGDPICEHNWENDFCVNCNAWRGELGLEPSFELFINHLIEIFNEVKRVLKKTGVCFVNLGDTYIGSPAGNKEPAGFQQLHQATVGIDYLAQTPNLQKGDGAYNRLQKRNGLGENNAKYVISKSYPDPKYGPRIRGREQVPRQNLPDKCLAQIPSRFAIAMVDNGFILRNEIIWHKPNPLPSSAKDRFTVDFEKIFMFVKSKNYYFETQYESYTEPLDRWGGDNLVANGESLWCENTGQNAYRDRNLRTNPLGRQKRCVWRIPTKPFKEAHFATFPMKLVEPMLLAGVPEFICTKCGKPRTKIYENGEVICEGGVSKRSDAGLNSKPEMIQYEQIFKGYTDCGCNAEFESGLVLDIFMGAGTTACVAIENNRNFIGIELNPDYIEIAEKRIQNSKEKMKQTQLF